MSARDELGKLLFTLPVSDRAADTAPEIMDRCDDAADAVLAAGYRKPRTITTAEELDALPVESVVRSDMGTVYVKDYDLDDPSAIWWVTAGAVSEFQSSRIALPATVLHEPEATK